MSTGFFDPSDTRRAYWFWAVVFSLVAWLYWEGMNAFQFHWWAIDGLPTYVAGKLWLAGEADAVYQSQLWVHDGASPAWESMLWKLRIPNVGTTFVYHPIYLFLALPFVALLSVNQFIVLLLSVNALSVGLLVMEILRLSGGAGGERRKLAAVFVCISFPALYAAFLGQNVLPTLVLLLCGWRFLRARRPVLGSALLTLAVAVKLWALPIVLLALAMRGMRVWIIGLCCVSGGLVVLPLVAAPALFSDYLDIAARLTNITVYPYNNVSVRAGFARLDNPEWVAEAFLWTPKLVPTWIRLGEVMLVGILIATAGVLWWRSQPPTDFVFAGALSLILLLPGVCWTHYLIFSMPAAVLLWLCASGWRSWVGLAALIFMAIPWHPIPRGIFPREPFRQLVETHPEILMLGLLLPLAMATTVGLYALTLGRPVADVISEHSR